MNQPRIPLRFDIDSNPKQRIEEPVDSLFQDALEFTAAEQQSDLDELRILTRFSMHSLSSNTTIVCVCVNV